MKNFVMTLFFAIIVFTLPVLVFTLNRPQDLRQQAASNNSLPTPIPTIAGCPEVNHDNTTNICRAQFNCELGEVEKEDGKAICSDELGKSAICCNIR